uniref:Uncharacterized protein n=1 Tax=Corethron hystrix TaxID=216773 RepID=A0A7S1B6X6_9STRA|mmetsp:Transcript_14907/g.33092  ORF Transcript_14907/g.33092 Transcript_14907/m.33092 type:complete len:216 (+) Transcript_14907:279-926(+)
MQTDASRFALPVTWSMRSRPKGLAEGPHRSRRGDASKRLGLQYFCPDDPDNKFGRDRVETEAILERSHAEMEVEYRCWISNYHGEDISGSVPFHNGFPPYLGRLCGGFWQIRTPFASSAIRWITRGLLHSGHLSEVEKIATSSPGGGSVMVANAYMKSEHLFDCVQRPVVSRAKKKEVEEEMEEEQEKIELSEYERMRADRVARNKERLKMLGLG